MNDYDTVYYSGNKLKFIKWLDNEYIIRRSKNIYHETKTLNVIKDLHIDGTYIDIGAYIGTHSIVFSKIFNADRVIAFEPQKNIYEILLENLELNNIDNVFSYNVGLGNHKFNGISYIDEIRKNLENFGATRIDEDKSGNIPINILDDYNFKDVHLIKIDVEGYEREVLEGAKLTIDNNDVKCIITECHNKNDYDKQLSLLKDYGFARLCRRDENIIWLKK